MHTSETPLFVPTFKQAAISALCLFAVTFIVYGASLGGSFIALDDPFLIYNNLAIRSITLETLKHIFTTYDPELYIPLTFFSFQINYLIGGLSPFSYHLLNLILHTFNALFVTWLFILLTKNKFASMLGGLLFAIHPLNTEVVLWATARKESLSGFFFLISLLSYAYYRERAFKKTYVLSLVSFLLALLSKVTVFTLPAILILVDWFQGRRESRRSLLLKVPYVVLSIVFVLIGIIPKTSVLSSTTFAEKMLMAGKSVLFYVWKFTVPVNLSILYPNRYAISLLTPEFSLSLLAMVLILAGIVFSLKRTKIFAFGFGFFFITIGPTLLHFNRNASIQSADATGIQFASDHYAYMPMIGLLFLTAIAALKLWKLEIRTRTAIRVRVTTSVIGASLVLGFSMLALQQSSFWMNSETLFTRTLSIYPYSTAARVNLSVIYRQTGRFKEERKVLEEGMTFGPNSKLETGLAAIDVRAGNFSSAQDRYSRALMIDPMNSDAHFGIGAMLGKQGKIAEAIEAYDRAIALDPKYVAAYNNRGSLLLEEGKEAAAEKDFRTAVMINPSFNEGFFNLGALYARQGKFVEATESFEQALIIEPNSVETRLELVLAYLELGKNSLALEQIKTILTIDPKNEKAKAILKQMIKLGIVG